MFTRERERERERENIRSSTVNIFEKEAYNNNNALQQSKAMIMGI